MSTLLALDSSTEILSLALSSAQGQHVYEGEAGAKASEAMVPQALALLAAQGLRLDQLDAIAFGRGPGAFTGLRTACAVAQGLAFGAGKPVLALDSLMLVAEDARLQAQGQVLPSTSLDGLWVVMDARMGEVYAAAYAWRGAAWQTLVEPALYAPEALLQRWTETPPTALCGSALTAFPALAGTPLPAWPQERSRATALASLAGQAWRAGALLDAAEALPLYVRDKVAQTTAERAAARPQP